MSDDPYAPPREKSIPEVDPLAGPDELATRWSRFLAVLIDMAIILAIFVPAAIITGLTGVLSLDESSRLEDIAFELSGILVFLAINYRLLVTRGQTIGKRLIGIQAVDQITGQLMPMHRVVLIRNLWYLPFTIISYLVSPEWSALVGTLIVLAFLVDAIAIFAVTWHEQHGFVRVNRCLHDHFAGSKVVRFDPSRGRVDGPSAY